MVAGDRIELPTRGFSIGEIQQLATNYNNKNNDIAYSVVFTFCDLSPLFAHECAMSAPRFSL